MSRHSSRSRERRKRRHHSYESISDDEPSPPRRKIKREYPSPHSRRHRHSQKDEKHLSSKNSVKHNWGIENTASIKEDKEAKRAKRNKEIALNKEKPNFELSGALAKETNTYRGIVLKYAEPPEARVPKKRWRLYPFKGDESLKPLHLHRQSAYLIGRQRRFCDIELLHPSISKQHAVYQYRSVPKQGEEARRVIRPYIIDLNSANGTYLNNQQIEPQRYYELQERDVLKFGFSSREFVLLHEKSKDSDNEDGAD